MGSGGLVRRDLVPSLPARFVRRPRIPYLLGSLIEDYAVVCVYATAGAGKTTAVVHATHETSRRVAWLTVEDNDAAPGRLLTKLEAVLGTKVANCQGVATRALAAHIPHSEAAGLLADAIDNRNILVVLDELERLADAPDALAVIESFLRYTPPGARAVLISRREMNLDLGQIAGPGRIAAVGEADLAFTVDEAAEALEEVGATATDPAAAVRATGGWVTGVLFEAWRSTDHVVGAGGEADPLDGYLSQQILAALKAEDREFLIATSILPHVTAEAAEALGTSRPGERLASLRAAHLPVSWNPLAHAMSCHPRFREYLLQRLEERGSEAVAELRTRYARLLSEAGHHEEAVEEFLKVPAPAEAVLAAEKAIEPVIERLDFAVAERWLEELRDYEPPALPSLTTAKLMLAIAQENYGRGVDIADSLDAIGQRSRLARASARAAGMMAWCYFHAGRVADARAVLRGLEGEVTVAPMRYALNLADGGTSEPVPPLSGGPLDALIMRTHYYLGALPLLTETPESSWAARVAEPWRVGGLRAMGRTEEALELYELIAARDGGVWHSAILSVELMYDLGRPEAAWRALARGRERIRASGSIMLELISFVLEAKLEVRLNRDSAAAQHALRRFEADPVGAGYQYIAAQAETWFGASLLLDDRPAEARVRLQRAVDIMVGGHQILELPTAAVYLAEAEHRLGHEEAADWAGDLALDAARRQASDHLLLQALGDFPSVVSRRLQGVAQDGHWHELGRALVSRGVAVEATIATDVVVREFGTAAILVNGTDVTPRLTKAYELLAYLASHPRHEATKEILLDALFESRTDESARAYLRQALHKLRAVLPEGAVVALPDGRVGLSDDVKVTSDSCRFESLLTQAPGLPPKDRLTVTLEALQVVDAGQYLPGVVSPWAEDRRDFIATLAQDARMDAAELAFAAGLLRDAEHLVARVTKDDPFREATWRLGMRIASAMADEDRVIALFRSCERALREIGAVPSSTTRRLLEALRR